MSELSQNAFTGKPVNYPDSNPLTTAKSWNGNQGPGIHLGFTQPPARRLVNAVR